MIDALLYQLGYPGLLITCFLAATIIPLSSEAAVALMATLGYDVYIIFILATLGNYLGTLANYYIGKGGGNFLIRRFIQIEPQKLAKAQKLFDRWGSPVLFFSFLPIIGDPLTIVAGVFKVPLFKFSLLVITGRAMRYVVVLGLVKMFV